MAETFSANWKHLLITWVGFLMRATYNPIKAEIHLFTNGKAMEVHACVLEIPLNEVSNV